jgi:hypothetical protein
VALQDRSYPDQQGFSTGEILWAVGVWSTILTLTPMIMFYVLMLA